MWSHLRVAEKNDQVGWVFGTELDRPRRQRISSQVAETRAMLGLFETTSGGQVGKNRCQRTGNRTTCASAVDAELGSRRAFAVDPSERQAPGVFSGY